MYFRSNSWIIVYFTPSLESFKDYFEFCPAVFRI